MRSPALASAVDATHPIAPIAQNRPSRPLGKSLKVVAFNAKGGAAVESIIDCLRRPPLAPADVILLCEADWNYWRSKRRQVAAEVAEALNLSFAYLGAFALPEPGGEPVSFTGVAILCSQPLEGAYAIPLSYRRKFRRVRRMIGGPAGLVVRAHFRSRTVHLGVVHLSSNWDPPGRALQMDEFLRRVPSEGLAIVGGDFNTTTVSLPRRSSLLHAYLRLMLEPRRLSDPRRWETLLQRLELAGFRLDGPRYPFASK
jgi:endonuclease/exonuclease/phosphatase family metal-dependent hydrolase